MARGSGGGSAADYLGGNVESFTNPTPSEQASGNQYFDQSSVNDGTLGTELGTGSYFTDDGLSAYDTNPVFGVDDGSLGSPSPTAPQNPNNPPSSGGGGPTPSAKSIADIKTQLLKPATTSHYICKFMPPETVEAWESAKEQAGYAGAAYMNRFNQELIELLCCDASLPGSTLATHDINNDFHGVTQKNAYRRLYDDRADFTFYVDREYTTLRFFEGWMSYIVNENQDGSGKTPTIDKPSFFYRINYPKNYKCNELYITKFEKDIERGDAGSNLEYKFFEAFPISVSSMPVSYEASQLLKCTVSFSFSRYLIKRITASSKPNPSPNNIGPDKAPGVPELNKPIGQPPAPSPAAPGPYGPNYTQQEVESAIDQELAIQATGAPPGQFNQF